MPNDEDKPDLDIYMGLDFGPVTITCTNTADNSLYDLTGHAVYAQIRKDSGLDLIASLAAEITNAEGGVITLSLPRAQTATLPAGGYKWDLIVQLPDETRPGPPWMAGKVTIHKVITNPADA